MHDPTSPDRQGADVGSQYRSILLYTTVEQREAAERFIRNLQTGLPNPIVTEVRRLDRFWPAEEHHRRYYEKNRFAPYCLAVIGPKIAKVKKKYGML
jgi:peptide-methionine (S)-S-oxide reductase